MDNSRESNAARIDRESTWLDRWANAEAIGSGDGGIPPVRRRDLLSLLAPSVLAVVYGLIALVAGGALFDTGQPMPGAGVAFALLGALFALATHGTLRLFDDARLVADAGDEWQPNPWWYLANGALVLLALQAARFSAAATSVPDPIPVYAGTLVVALPIASLVAGPLYVIQRLRHS